MRLIDADALLNDGIRVRCGFYDNGLIMIPMRDVRESIKNAPTIEAEPVKHGIWIGTADGYADGELVYDMWECSECGFDADGADEKPDWHYCPNCGAKMDGGDAE